MVIFHVALVILVFGTVSSYSTNYTDLFAYLEAVGRGRNNIVLGLLAPRFELSRVVALLRSHMLQPWPAMGLPRLDPMKLPDHFSLDDPEFGRFEGGLEECELQGLATFHVNELIVDLSNLSVNFDLTWQRLHLLGAYDLRGEMAGGVALHGNGSMNVTLKDAHLWGHLQLQARDSLHLGVHALDLNVALGEATGKLEGLQGGGRLGEVLASVALEVAPEVVRVVGPRVVQHHATSARLALERHLQSSTSDAMRRAVTWARSAPGPGRYTYTDGPRPSIELKTSD